MSDRLRIGVDLGGSKIETLALAPDGGERGRLRRPTPKNSYEDVVVAVAEACFETARLSGSELNDAVIGVGAPGSHDPATGHVRNANIVVLNGRPFCDDLMAALPAPVTCANDADCFTLSEAADGAGAGAASVFGAIIGTGVGGGLVRGGRLVADAGATAGEWGHIPAPATARDGPSRRCWCGRDDCMEAWLSGPALALSARAALGVDLAAPEIAARVALRDGAAAALLDGYAARLAAGLAVVADMLRPETIVLGGGLSNLPGIAQNVEVALRRIMSGESAAPIVRGAKHGDASGVRGAARLWPVAPGRKG